MYFIALILILVLIFIPILGSFENATHHDHPEEEKEIVLDFSNDPQFIIYSDKAIGGDFIYYDLK
jgi:hypothetical protein